VIPRAAPYIVVALCLSHVASALGATPAAPSYEPLRLRPVIGVAFPIQEGNTPVGSQLGPALSAGASISWFFAEAPVEFSVGAMYSIYGQGGLRTYSTNDQGRLRVTSPDSVDGVMGVRYWLHSWLFADATVGGTWTSVIRIRDIADDPRRQVYPQRYYADVPSDTGGLISIGLGTALIPLPSMAPGDNPRANVLLFSIEPTVRILGSSTLWTVPFYLGVDI
jgi:hypothetical protein